MQICIANALFSFAFCCHFWYVTLNGAAAKKFVRPVNLIYHEVMFRSGIGVSWLDHTRESLNSGEEKKKHWEWRCEQPNQTYLIWRKWKKAISITIGLRTNVYYIADESFTWSNQYQVELVFNENVCSPIDVAQCHSPSLFYGVGCRYDIYLLQRTGAIGTTNILIHLILL